MLNEPVIRPTAEDAQMLRIFRTIGDKRVMKPGLPLRKFVNTTLGTSIVTRDYDLYAAAPGWTETTRRGAP